MDDRTAESKVLRTASSTASSPRPLHLHIESMRRNMREEGCSEGSISQRMRRREKRRKQQSRAGSTTLGEDESMARMRGRMKDSASDTEETPYRGVDEEESSVRVSSLSRADLQAATM